MTFLALAAIVLAKNRQQILAFNLFLGTFFVQPFCFILIQDKRLSYPCMNAFACVLSRDGFIRYEVPGVWRNWVTIESLGRSQEAQPDIGPRSSRSSTTP